MVGTYSTSSLCKWSREKFSASPRKLPGLRRERAPLPKVTRDRSRGHRESRRGRRRGDPARRHRRGSCSPAAPAPACGLRRKAGRSTRASRGPVGASFRPFTADLSGERRGISLGPPGATKPHDEPVFGLLERRGWDSNPRDRSRGLAVFKTAPLDHSGTPPGAKV